jgi:hypothetical protein
VDHRGVRRLGKRAQGPVEVGEETAWAMTEGIQTLLCCRSERRRIGHDRCGVCWDDLIVGTGLLGTNHDVSNR